MNIIEIIDAKLKVPRAILRLQISDEYITISALNGRDQISRKIPIVELTTDNFSDAAMQDSILQVLRALTPAAS